MSRSEIDVCNRALRLVRARAISSFSDGHLAGLCEAVYPEVRDEILSAYPWNCAMARASLPQLADPPAFGFKRQFQLPSDCLRVWRVVGDPKWTREGQRLLTDAAPPIYIRYITQVAANRMDVWVAKTIATKMAAEMAPSITENVSLTERLLQLFEIEFKAAKRLDAQEGTPDVEEDEGSWAQARRG